MTGPNRIGRWALWTVVTAVGYSLGLYAGFVLAHVLLGALMAAACMGAGVGVLQRPIAQSILEPRRSHSWAARHSAAWILGSMAGILLAVTIWLVSGEFLVDRGRLGTFGPLLAVVCFALGGALTGALQEPVLRNFVLGSRRWIVASSIGWGLSALGLGIVYGLSDDIYPLLAILLGPAIGGAALGIVTGGVLLTLPRRPNAGSITSQN